MQLQGTLRAFTDDVFQRLQRRITEVIVATAQLRGCNATDLTWSPTPYPPTVNDPAAAGLAMRVAQQLAAAARAADGDNSSGAGVGGTGAGAGSPNNIMIQELGEPSMAAEDFSFFGKGGIPSAFVMLGIGNATLGTDVSLHNHMFQMDESQLHVGAALHASLAFEALSQVATARGTVESSTSGSGVSHNTADARHCDGMRGLDDAEAGMCNAGPA